MSEQCIFDEDVVGANIQFELSVTVYVQDTCCCYQYSKWHILCEYLQTIYRIHIVRMTHISQYIYGSKQNYIYVWLGQLLFVSTWISSYGIFFIYFFFPNLTCSYTYIPLDFSTNYCMKKWFFFLRLFVVTLITMKQTSFF